MSNGNGSAPQGAGNEVFHLTHGDYLDGSNECAIVCPEDGSQADCKDGRPFVELGCVDNEVLAVPLFSKPGPGRIPVRLTKDGGVRVKRCYAHPRQLWQLRADFVDRIRNKNRKGAPWEVPPEERKRLLEACAKQHGVVMEEDLPEEPLGIRGNGAGDPKTNQSKRKGGDGTNEPG